MSRLSGMRESYENFDAFQRIAARTKNDIPREHDISTREGRGDALNALYAERRVTSMTNTIYERVGGQMSAQELKDAQYLLNRMART